MTKDELYETLKPLAEAMQNTLASKQHVFTDHLDLVIKCKESGISNQMITEGINHHLNDDDKINLTYFKNLLHRAGYTRKEKRQKLPRKNTSPASSGKAAEPMNKIESEVITVVDENDLNEYMKVCFHNERLARRAIEGSVSIAIIESWKAPNAQRLSTILTNYLLDK